MLDTTRRNVLKGGGIAATALAMASSPAVAAGPAAAAADDPRDTPLYPRASATRSVRDLSGLWRFRLDPTGIGEQERWYEGLSGSRVIPVPCSWNDLFDDAHDYFGAAWYEAEVQLAALAPGRRLHLRFGSAVYRARVWLNGRLLGEHVGGHLPFAFDVTAVAQAGVNRLSVMVENRLSLDRVPAVPDAAAVHFYQEDYPQTSYDFFPYSGLHRPVWLVETPDIHLRDIVVRPRLDGGARVEIELRVAGGWSGPASVTIAGDAGATVATVRLAVRGGIGRATVATPGARLWSHEDPFLHRLTARLGGAAVIDEYVLPIGIREVRVQGEQLLLNGKPVHLRGFGKHEDFIIHGRGLDLPVLVRDYELLRWLGANSFRTSHYPYAEEALQLADEYGFLVIAETPAVSLTFSDRPDVIAARHRQLSDDITDLIARDKNHPCVILWSLANEPLTKPFHTTDPSPAGAVAAGTRFFADMFAHARALDPTRPVAIVSVQGGPVEWVEQGDVICTNSYDGWYAVSGRLDDAKTTLRREMAALHARCGAKPVIVTEFGADAMAGIHAEPPEMWSEDYQAAMIAAYLDVLADMPWVVGTHPWAFADFRTSQSIMRVGSLNLKGVFTRDRRPKEAARLLRRRWNPKAREA